MARRGRRLTILAVAAVPLATVVLAACADRSGGSPAEPALPLLGEWELLDGSSGDTTVPRPDGTGATLTFADGRVSGASFCNHYGGTYVLSGSSLALDGLGGTEMACAPEVMTAESVYLRALGAVDTAAVEDGDLVLTGEGAALRFGRVAPAPAFELVGTRWVLETLVQGEVASSTLGEPAVLVLLPDGTLSGSTGCRTLSGRWARTDDRLVFPEWQAHGDCPAGVRAQDEHVLAVLDAETIATVDGDRLTVNSRNGLGLVYRAES
jgi:heat shock protein HslJ